MTKKADLQQPTPKQKASELFSNFLKENNIVITLSPPSIKNIDDGSIIIEKPNLIVGYGRTKK